MVSLRGSKVYLDASVVIYTVEGLAGFPNLKAGLIDLLDASEVEIVTSQLTLLETIVFPRRNGDAAAEQKFRAFLTPSSKVNVLPISQAVLEKATDLRAQFPALKTPDAIHLATGLTAGCHLFVTGDQAWSKIGVNVVDPVYIA